MPYATLVQARAFGLTAGTDLEVTALLAEAEQVVDFFCDDLFSPRVMTVILTADHDGLIALPARAGIVASVTPAYPQDAAPLDPDRYAVRRSGTGRGSRDVIDLLGWSYDGGNLLVKGAEPWAGGWHHLSTAHGRRPAFTVVGTFGAEVTPAAVTRATVAVAEALREAGISGTDTDGIASLSMEGYSVRYETGTNDMSRRSTGSLVADRLLRPYARKSRAGAL